MTPPDLKSIEDEWNLIKNFIENKYADLPGGKERSYYEIGRIFKKHEIV